MMWDGGEDPTSMSLTDINYPKALRDPGMSYGRGRERQFFNYLVLNVCRRETYRNQGSTERAWRYSQSQYLLIFHAKLEGQPRLLGLIVRLA
jgi:hypothetical protein